MNYLLSALNMHKNDNKQQSNDCCEAKPASALKMQVLLRIRPASPLVDNKTQSDAYVVQNPVSLLVRNFNANDSARRSKASEGAAFRKFSFNQIFNQQIDQSQFFNQAVQPRLQDFLTNNQSFSIISYGSTDAGKTYTVFGPSNDPGILPRSIQYIFASINCTLSPWYKPEQSQTIVSLPEEDRDLEVQVAKDLTCRRLIDRTACERAYSRLVDDCSSSSAELACTDCMFSVWISFIEIYNDCVYDLLQVDEDGKNMPLKLSTDKHGSTYVQGMRSVCATTGLEAYEILNAGQTRLSTLSASNYKSSRSHSIFSMRLLKYDRDSTPSAVQMNSVSFYDLAGTGKLQQSASSDKQLKESRSINTSLLAFGRCLKALAEGHSRQSAGPFRDCKLTRLFQHSLRKENLIIVVNLNPSFELFAETQNVLNFASTAIKLTPEFVKEDKRPSSGYQSPVSSPKLAQTASSIAARPLRDQDIHEILAKNKQLLDQINDFKSAELSREYKLRQELADYHNKQLNDLEQIWKNRMSVAEEQKEYLLKLSANEHFERKRKTTNAQSTDSMPICEKNQQYACEVSWLKDHLRRIADFVRSSDKYDGHQLIVDELSMENFECFNNDTISHIQSIVAFIKDSCAKQQTCQALREKSTKTTQCNLDLSSLLQYCQTIQALFPSNDISLPELDDSLELTNDLITHSNTDLCLTNLIDRLCQIKQSILQCLSGRDVLRAENHEKQEELGILRAKNEELDVEILRTREQQAASECARLALLKKCESLEMSLKSKQVFKNAAFDGDEAENSMSCCFREEMGCLEQSDGHFEISELDCSSVNAESNATRSDSDTSKNDSGLGFGLDSVSTRREEKYSQTDKQWGEEQHEILKDKLVQLNVDYNRMEAQHLQGSRRITELSLQLEGIRDAMLQLKENTCMKDRTISECQSQLQENKAEIDRLNAQKKQVENQLNELRDNLLAVSQDYEKKLGESEVKLRVQEEGEDRTARCLKDYWEKSVNLGCELTIAYSELEKFSLSCYKEHVLKIHKLEDELNEKKVCLANLNEQMNTYEKDLAEMIALSGKVDECEGALSRLQKQKFDVDKIIKQRSESQLIIQNQLRNLTEKIGERDDQILSLKWQLETIVKTNLSNSRKAKELGREVTRLIEKMCSMKEDIAESETARTDLERKSNKQIDNLRARLTIFEGNADLLNLIRNSDESKQCEMDKLKLKVLQKDKQLEFLKKNRNATIRRYECLVQQLQKSLKMNSYPSRTNKILSLKHSYCLDDLTETTCCYNVYDADRQIGDWKKECLQARDQIQSVVHLSRKNVQVLETNVENCIIEESCCRGSDFSGKELAFVD